jgi:hypothetical protein
VSGPLGLFWCRGGGGGRTRSARDYGAGGSGKAFSLLSVDRHVLETVIYTQSKRHLADSATAMLEQNLLLLALDGQFGDIKNA